MPLRSRLKARLKNIPAPTTIFKEADVGAQMNAAIDAKKIWFVLEPPETVDPSDQEQWCNEVLEWLQDMGIHGYLSAKYEGPYYCTKKTPVVRVDLSK